MIIISYSYIIFVLVCACSRYGFSQNPEIDTTSGVVIGKTHSKSHSFYSVRYGKPPVR